MISMGMRDDQQVDLLHSGLTEILNQEGVAPDLPPVDQDGLTIGTLNKLAVSLPDVNKVNPKETLPGFLLGSGPFRLFYPLAANLEPVFQRVRGPAGMPLVDGVE